MGYSRIKLLTALAAGAMLTGCATTVDSSAITDDSAQESVLSAQARTMADEVINLRKITCWEMATLSEETVGYAWALLFGYAARDLGKDEYVASSIGTAIAEAAETCAENPGSLAIDVFNLSE